MRGWQMAIERVRPIPRDFARMTLAKEVQAQLLSTPLDVVLYLERRFFEVKLQPADREEMAAFLAAALGTTDIKAAVSYAEEPLRRLLHAMLSRPEYQLG